jgi:hypothetical protein
MNSSLLRALIASCKHAEASGALKCNNSSSSDTKVRDLILNPALFKQALCHSDEQVRVFSVLVAGLLVLV